MTKGTFQSEQIIADLLGPKWNFYLNSESRIQNPGGVTLKTTVAREFTVIPLQSKACCGPEPARLVYAEMTLVAVILPDAQKPFNRLELARFGLS